MDDVEKLFEANQTVYQLGDIHKLSKTRESLGDYLQSMEKSPKVLQLADEP